MQKGETFIFKTICLLFLNNSQDIGADDAEIREAYGNMRTKHATGPKMTTPRVLHFTLSIQK